MSGFIKSYRAALIWAAFVLFLCLLPGEELPEIDFWEIKIEDKLAHVAVFAILSGLTVWGAHIRRDYGKVPIKAGFYIFTLVALYGVLTELLQYFLTTSRYASLSDFVADGIGSLIGTLLIVWYINRYRAQDSAKQ